MPAADQSREEAIRDYALSLGFDAARITTADLPARTAERLGAYLAEQRHGDMAWMEVRAAQRASPRALWPEAKAAIMLGMNYGPSTDPMAALAQKSNGVISVYAQNKDYHDIIKKRLKRLARWVIEHYGGEVKVFVDTAPVMEKPLAAQAGIGWQGKHTNLVSRDHGAWLFLGSVFVTLDLEPDQHEDDHCGTCQRCLDICPTHAFPAPYQLDARRCISYLTIEHKGPIPRHLRKAMGNRIYGCDDCLAVCPWNKFAATASETAFHARQSLRSPSLAQLAALDDAAFRKLFSGSPVKRTGRDHFVRNVLTAVGNSNDAALAASARNLVEDEAPVVRSAAVWALHQLLTQSDFNALKKQYAPTEKDESVLLEWNIAVGEGVKT